MTNQENLNDLIKQIIDYAWNKKVGGIIDLFRNVKFTKHEIPTMGVDKDSRLWINTDFLNKLDVKEAFEILCHEYMHNIYCHYERAHFIYKHEEHELSNIAADIVVNEFLKKEYKIVLKNGCYKDNIEKIFFVKFNKMDFNSIYEVLIEKKNSLKTNSQEYDFDEKTENLKNSMSNSNYGRTPLDKKQKEVLKSFMDKLTEEEKQELEKSLEKIEKLENENSSDNENDSKEKDTSIGSKAAKTGIADRLAKIFTAEKADYLIDFLRNKLGKLLENSFYRGWNRPNRYGITNLPCYRSEKPTPKIGIYIDISGSMEDCADRLINMLRNVGSNLSVYNPDYYIFNTELKKIDIKNEEIEVGGGTNINLVLDNIKANDDYSIIFTDMEDIIKEFNNKKVLFFTNNKEQAKEYGNKCILLDENFSNIINYKKDDNCNY